MNRAQLIGLTLPQPTRAPLAWLKADELPVAFRACFLCMHGADAGIERVCNHPALLEFGAPQPVAIVRAWGGGCGPDAQHHCDRPEAS
ncbi:hypothetical protein ACG02S_07925 [Roseateles sp. DC23W]|uniref:Uncharacterized protein n=1 Tax=Pelomonas dachongensis TaxID=3299029 RepID=A0ABW7EK45_9BURK